MDVGGAGLKGGGDQEGKREKVPGKSSQSDRKGPLSMPPPPKGLVGEDSKQGLEQGIEPRTTICLNIGPQSRS